MTMNRMKKALKRTRATLVIGVAALTMVAAPVVACPPGDLPPGQWSFVIVGTGGVGAGGVGHFCVEGDPVNGVQQIEGSFESHWPNAKAGQKTFTGTLTETGAGLAEQMDIKIAGVSGNQQSQSIHIEAGSPTMLVDNNGDQVLSLATVYDGRVLK